MPEMEITINQMPAFKKAYKKFPSAQKLLINKTIEKIIADPEIGETKKGDLLGIYVYKFKLDHQEMLLAYEWDPQLRLLFALGVHENFYRDLKRQR